MKLGPSDECAAGHGPVPRKIEALNTGSTCPSRDRDKWGKERQAGEVRWEYPMHLLLGIS